MNFGKSVIGLDSIFPKKLNRFVRRNNVDVEEVNPLLRDERLVPVRDGIMDIFFVFFSVQRQDKSYWNKTHSRIEIEINGIFRENFLTR